MKKKEKGIFVSGAIVLLMVCIGIFVVMYEGEKEKQVEEASKQDIEKEIEEEIEKEGEGETEQEAEGKMETEAEPEKESEEEMTKQESPFHMANPIPDETYTGIVGYQAEKVFESEDGLSTAEIIITMPQLTMRSATAGMINEKLLEFYTEEYETGLSGVPTNMDFNYTYETGYRVTFMNEKYLSILAEGYEYAGGAHGMPYRVELIFNLETGEQVHGESLFQATEEQIHTVKLEAYKELFEKSEEGEYWENPLSIVETTTEEAGGYYLTEEGVTFFYSPYTLAPYAAGYVEVTVPYEKLPLK